MALGLTKLFLLFLITGCAGQLQTLTPATNLLTSEAQGEFLKTTVSATAMDGVNTFASIDENSTDVKFSSAKSFTQIAITPQTGLSSRVDAFMKIGTHAPIMYGLKWQMFGDTKKRARRKSSSFSIYMSGGRQRYQTPSESNIPISGDYKANRTHTVIDYGALYGKRLYSDILAYTRVSKIIDEMHGSFDFEENTNLDQTKFNIEGSHISWGLGLLWHTRKINLGLEYSIMKTSWKDISDTTANSFLVVLSKDFN